MRPLQSLAAALEQTAAYKPLIWLWGRLPIPNWLRWWVMWLGVQRFLVGVSAVVLNEQGEVLLFKHTYRPQYPWGLPGGWLKGGEDPTRAVEREIHEESGLTARILRPVSFNNDRDFPWLDAVFLGQIEGGRFAPSAEVSEACFFPLDHLPPLRPYTHSLILKVIEQEGLTPRPHSPG